MTFGFFQRVEGKTYGLPALRPEENARLENLVGKVVQVAPNALGTGRIAEASGEAQPLEAAPPENEFTLLNVSSDEAAAQIATSATLPLIVNNSLLPSFPPIGNQEQLGSCVAWGSTYYQATHEIGLLNTVNNQQGMQGVLSPKWTYDLLNGGVDDGLSVLSAYQLLAINGAPSIVNFPYDANYTAWDLHVQDWVSAINNRMASYALIPGLGGSGAQNLTAIKTALVNGHVLTFATFIDSWVFTQVKHDPQNLDNNHVGELAAVYMNGTDGGHFMTIVGYNDNLWIDVNGNGEVDAGERGAFLIANSWGTSWGNQGFVWISYDAFLAASGVHGGPNAGRVPAGIYLNSNVITVAPKAKHYSPSLIAQFSLSQADRNQIAIQAGISNVNQTTPAATLADYGLTNQGGALEFNGANPSSAQAMTFALDYTDLLASATGSTAERFYLTVGDDATGNPTTLNSYTLLDLVHNNQVSASNLPKSYDDASGTVFIDYNFSQGIVPAPVVPTVFFTSPQSGATLEGTVSVSASASDSLGIASVQLYVDSVLSGAMTLSSGAYTASLSTTKLSNGSHTLEAIATNTSGHTAQATMSVQVENPVVRPSLFLNAGGPTLSYAGQVWTNDSGYVSGTVSTGVSRLPFANPVYDTERVGPMTYHFNVPNGNYSVTLKFAEIFFTHPRQRVFNAAINGTSVIQSLDLIAAAGYGVPYDRTFPVSVTNGSIVIAFSETVNFAKISAIEIVPVP